MTYLTDENGNPLTAGGKLIRTPASRITDVQIDGKSIAENGVAQIPFGSNTSYGVVKGILSKGVGISNNGVIEFQNGGNVKIDERSNNYAVLNGNIDYAVKAAMCDGKGAAWTAEEQAAARERMGTWSNEWKITMDETLEEDANNIAFTVPDNTKEMICYLKSESLESISSALYLRTINTVSTTIGESYAAFNGSLEPNKITVGFQKLQFLSSKYAMVEYTSVTHNSSSSTDNEIRYGKMSVLRVDSKRFQFRSVNTNSPFKTGTHFMVFVRT